jgi:hypothetical protein
LPTANALVIIGAILAEGRVDLLRADRGHAGPMQKAVQVLQGSL